MEQALAHFYKKSIVNFVFVKSFFSLNTAASVQTTRVPRPQRDSMGKKAVAKAFSVAFEPGPMGPMVDAAVDRALSLAFGPGARPALAIFFHHALLALSVCLLIFVLSKLLSPRLFRKALSKLEPFERKIWHTNMVTFFPAFAVTYYAWPAIVAYDGAKYDFLHPASVDTLKGCGMSLGYMFWDLVVLLADPKDQMKAYGGLSPYVLFLFHHTLSLLAWPYAVSAGRCTYFVNYFLVSEVTNANLSLRWFLMKSTNAGEASLAYFINGIVWIPLFFAVRVCVIPELVDRYVNGDWSKLGPIETYAARFLLPVPVALNVYWFGLIVTTAYGALFGKESKKESKKKR